MEIADSDQMVQKTLVPTQKLWMMYVIPNACLSIVILTAIHVEAIIAT